MFEEKMSETIEAGAPSIKYNRGDVRMGQGQGDQRSMQVAAEIWEQMEPQQKVQFGNFEKFYQSGIWRQILAQLQEDQQQEGIASQMPREMMEEQVSMSERVPARFGGDMDMEMSMRETIDTPSGIETIKEKDTMKMAGGGARGWKAQMLAEDLADEKYGKEFYDLTHEQQMEIYTLALDMIDSGGE
jgi:ethanolamine utilization protein EutQ (cupin superfamily)|tara:strand:+ start:209 stop:769 length:561 start_codon:yes stop_codon:yes gene_type:complete